MHFQQGAGVEDVGLGGHYLEVGDRTRGDEVSYPDDDLRAALTPEGGWRFERKDGTPY